MNRDKGDWKSGSSQSDQIMARALMTADELRRMDNDECIIFEKGIKPIKANKYYYFKYPVGKIVEKFKVDHNDVSVERTAWRKYNPMNPYEEGQENANDFPSLDSLFEDDDAAPASTSKPVDSAVAPSFEGLDSMDSLPGMEELNKKPEPTSPIQSTRKPKTTSDIDIQKELEAKFDELFGALDDDT